ncbi:MAG TPA: adenylate/guanylate cyclase domain-containing protein [Verrucomicrobiae bacterium]|nr:adenylate/guanylate cyclase domain-containing protein [Verrucomicrobiae bacterium]
MRLNFLKSPAFFIAAPIILGVCVLQYFQLGGFERLEWMTYDWRVRLASRHHGAFLDDATNLGLVEISDDTIAAVNSGTLGFKYGLYWPKEVYARALHELSSQGAQAVAFDSLFAELRADHPPVKLPDGTFTSSDDYFARQIKESGNVILGADQDLLPARLFRRSAWHVGNISVRHDSDGVLRHARAYQEYRVWHPFIEQMANEYGLDLTKTVVESNQITFVRKRGVERIVFPTDAFGQIATTNLAPLRPGIPEKFAPMTPIRVWSMGIVLAAHQLGLDLDHPEFKPGTIILHGTNGVVRKIPVDSNGNFYIDWSLRLNDPRLTEGSLEELLEGYIERANGRAVTNRWRGKLIVIGSTATGNDLADVGATALESSTFLVTSHLNVANSVITGRFIRATSLSWNLLLVVLVGSFSAWMTWVVPRPGTGSLLMLAFAILYTAGAFYLFFQFRIAAAIVLPLCCAGIVTHVMVVTHRVRVEQLEKRRVKQLFSRLVSPDVVNEVLTAPTLSLGGVRREVTVYFADVRGFTELTDVTHAQAAEYVQRNKLSAADAEAYYDAQARETLRTISLYLGTIADIVKQRRGLLDKYIGDCVMAFWGAPVANPQHAADAVRAAIDAQQALADLNEKRTAQNKRLEEENIGRVAAGLQPLMLLPLLSLGTGINTGLATVGYMGSETHLLNYTAFGREVNLASRLEGVSGHGRIIIGEATYAALKRDDPKLAAMCLEWPPRMVKGFREAVRIYEVLWRPDGSHPPPLSEDTAELLKAAKPT